jgi:multiple antibiotic resistance protein
MDAGTLLAGILRGSLALFIVMNPVGNLLVFVGLTPEVSAEERRRIFTTAGLVGIVLLIVFSLLGRAVLGVFHIQLHSFRIAGGILLLALALRLVLGGGTLELEKDHVGIVPLAFPLLVGPGAITTCIVLLGQPGGGPLVALGSAVVAGIVSLAILRSSATVLALLGTRGASILNHLMGMLLAAIAVEFIVTGITGLFPAIKR